METTAHPTSEERIIAAFAHASVLLSFLGPIVPAILWSTQRSKSKYVAYHTLQALGFQVLLFWCWILGSLLIGILMVPVFILLVSLIQSRTGAAEFLPFFFQFTFFLAFFGMWGLFILVGVVGGVLCLTGRDFRYPFLGGWLWRYLTGGQAADLPIAADQEANWAAAMCHASAILMVWGLVIPLILWLTRKDLSARFHFQSLQALLYQAIGTGLYVAGMVLYFVIIFAMMFVGILAGVLSSGPAGLSNASGGVVMILFLLSFLIILLFWVVALLLLPIYHLLAFIAALRVMRGGDYRYPILGKWLEGRLASG